MLGQLFYLIRSVFRALRNAIRGLYRAPDYVLIMLEDSYPELPDPPGPMWQRITTKPRTSLRELGQQFERMATDKRVKGVVLHIRPLQMSMAQLQTLRGFINNLKSQGKRVVAWSYSYQNASYYVASACDEILMLDGGTIYPLGLNSRLLFLADALKQIGVQFDGVQITPYKNAIDTFTRTEMSAETREMTNWLVDSVFGDFVEGIAIGRGTSPDGAIELINSTPLTDSKAVEKSAIDRVMSEEDLPAYLGSEERPAKIMPWEQADGVIKLPKLTPPGRYIAVVRVEGDIVDGRSQRPPMKPPILIPFATNNRAGDITVVQDARKVMRDPRVAAVVLYVDSGGGSATASEAMSAAFRNVAAKTPVVAYMGSVAASGGYYVSTPAQWVVAQPATFTGSIGVVYGKLVTGGLLDKLHINEESISRGDSIKLMDSEQPFTDEERAKVREYIEAVYELFMKRVSDARKKRIDEIDAIGGGRVWTGKQALEHGLIDELGDFNRALEKARELAGLNSRSPVREIHTEKSTLGPLAQPTAMMNYVIDGVRNLDQNILQISPITSLKIFK